MTAIRIARGRPRCRCGRGRRVLTIRLSETRDRFDAETSWALGPTGTHRLAELMLSDVLVVDVTKPFGDEASTEIGVALLAG